MEWPYYVLKNGRLIDEDGYEGNRNCPSFDSIEEAENWLTENDERGNVQ